MLQTWSVVSYFIGLYAGLVFMGVLLGQLHWIMAIMPVIISLVTYSVINRINKRVKFEIQK